MPSRGRRLALLVRAAAGRRSHGLTGNRINPTKDHSTCARLKDTGDCQFERFAKVIGSLLGNYHGSVVEVTDALTLLFTALEQFDREALARKDDGLHGVCEIVEVDDLDPLQPSNFIEVIVIGNDLPPEVFRQNNQPLVDFTDTLEFRDFGIMDPNLNSGRFLQSIEDVKPAPSAVSAKLVRAVRDTLELLEHESRNDELLVDHPGFGHIGDAAVDNH